MTPVPRRIGPVDRVRGQCRGFTLVELLVAVTLLGLISLVLFGGLRFGTRAWESGNAAAERLSEIEIVRSLVRRQIAQATIPGSTSKRAREFTAFEGESDRIRFVAPALGRVGVGGLYRFELALRDAEEGQNLELSWRLFRPDEAVEFDREPTETSGRRALLEGIEQATFDYYGSLEPTRSAEWYDRWEEAKRLPSLVSLKITFSEGDRRTWPDLLITPRLAGGQTAR